jgi:hypothetical protein
VDVVCRVCLYLESNGIHSTYYSIILYLSDIGSRTSHQMNLQAPHGPSRRSCVWFPVLAASRAETEAVWTEGLHLVIIYI